MCNNYTDYFPWCKIMCLSVIREGHVPLFVFGYWLCSSWTQTKTVRRQNDSAVSLSVPSLKLNPGSHTQLVQSSQLSAPLVEKHRLMLIFTAFGLRYSFHREVRVQVQRHCSTRRRMVETHRPANLCLFSSWGMVSHWQGYKLLPIFISKLFQCPFLYHSLSQSQSSTALPRWNVLTQKNAAPMMYKMSSDAAALMSASHASCLMFLADLQSAAENCTASLRLTATGAFLQHRHNHLEVYITFSLTPMTRPQKSNCRDLEASSR